MKIMIFVIAAIFSGPTAAYADYHTVLVGVRLHLKSTTIEGQPSYITRIENGIPQIYSSADKVSVKVPAKVIEGYIGRMSVDPKLNITPTTKPSDLGKERIWFIFESELVRLKFPRNGLARTRSYGGLFIPVGLIETVEQRVGPYEGDAGMGEPFYLPAWQAALMKDRKPVYSCSPQTERGEVEWVSYNRKIGEKELGPLCTTAQSDMALAARMRKKKNVFSVTYPAD